MRKVVRHAGRHRLFAQHVRAGTERRETMLGVQMMRRADMHDIRCTFPQHAGRIAIGFGLAEGLRRGERVAADRDQFPTRLTDQTHMYARDAAGTDNRYAWAPIHHGWAVATVSPAARAMASKLSYPSRA